MLVRVLTRDDGEQTAAAEAFLAEGAWVSQLALAEAVWVLQSRYGRRPAELAAAIQLLLGKGGLAIQDEPVVAAALALFRERPQLSFGHCLLLEQARAAGHLPLGTFDRELGRAPGAKWLKP